MSAPTSKQALLRCLNVTNSQSVPIDELDFGVPAPTTEYNKNTTIVLTARAGTDRFGSRRFWYDRADLSLLAMVDGEGAMVPVAMSNGQTLKDLLVPINLRHRTGLTSEDILDGDTLLPELSPQPRLITLRAAPGSYVWLGQLDVLVASAKTLIDTLLPEEDLPGFYYRLPIEALLPNEDLPGFVYEAAPVAT